MKERVFRNMSQYFVIRKFISDCSKDLIKDYYDKSRSHLYGVVHIPDKKHHIQKLHILR